jgi:hypothetical protein
MTGENRVKATLSSCLDSARIIGRFWLPFLASALAVYSFLAFLTPIEDNDFWWHLKTGEFIVTHETLPAIDPFSFSTPAAPGDPEKIVLSGYWLAQATYYIVYEILGLKGLILFRVVLLTLMFAIVYRRMERLEIDRGVSVILLAASLILYSDLYFSDRPQVFSFLGATLLVGMMERIREGRRPNFLLLPLMLVWSNLHGGFIIGDAFLAVFALGSMLQYRTDRRRYVTIALWSFSGIIVSLVNPNSYKVFTVVLGSLVSKSITWTFIDEFMSTFMAFGLGHHFVALLWFMSILVVTCMIIARRFYWPDFFLWAFTSYFAIAYVRNAAFFSVALVPLCGYYLNQALPALKRPRFVSFMKYAAGTVMLALMVTSAAKLVSRGSPLRREVGASLPVDVASFIQYTGLHGRIFNEYDWGGYLLWRLYPRSQVFIDGRLPNPARVETYGRILWALPDEQNGVEAYRSLLDSYHIDFVVARVYMELGNLMPLMIRLLNDPEWVPLYVDRQAFIFARRSSTEVLVVQRYGMSSAEFVGRAVTVYDGLIHDNPGDYRFYLAKGEMLIHKGEFIRAGESLLKAKQLSPSDYFVNRLLLYLKGQE